MKQQPTQRSWLFLDYVLELFNEDCLSGRWPQPAKHTFILDASEIVDQGRATSWRKLTRQPVRGRRVFLLAVTAAEY